MQQMHENENIGESQAVVIFIIKCYFKLKKLKSLKWIGDNHPSESGWRNKMIEVGRVCVKLAGRDASKKCVIVDILDDKFVLIDGETRRRRCNILHLEPLEQVVKIKKNASHGDVSKSLKDMGIETRETKPKQKTQKPKAKRKTSEQLRVQKVEKKKLRDIFRPKKKEEKAEAKETSLEEKAGLADDKKEEIKETKHSEKKEKQKSAKKTSAKK